MTSSTRDIWDPFLPNELDSRPFDFTARLGPSETISAQVVSVGLWSGTDSNPASILSGVASASGGVVSQNFQPTLSGQMYLCTCSIATSLGRTLKRTAILATLPGGP